MTTRTLGIDVAAQPRNTAACMIEWDEQGVGLVSCPTRNLDDQALLELMKVPGRAAGVAIDAPFGWPEQFIESIAAYQRSGRWPDPPGSSEVQDEMRLRATDRAVTRMTGLWPLSVSTDRLAVVAMRCARLLVAVNDELDLPLDRSGDGRFIEVYPAASLHQWGLSPRLGADPGSYKGAGPDARTRRQRIVELICRAGDGWLELEEAVRPACVDSDHCLDALISALTARAVQTDTAEPVEEPGLAQSEGWIRLPREGSLTQLRL